MALSPHPAKMSEIRKALELMKRVETVDDAPARRMALELGALACDRGEAAARRAQKPEQASDGGGGGDSGGGAGGGAGGSGGGCSTSGDHTMAVRSRLVRDQDGLRLGAGDTNRLLVVPCQGSGAGEDAK